MKIKEELRRIIINRRRNNLLKTINTKILLNPVYLVSFPRSGNTWIRLILANILANKKDKPLNFKNYHTLIPDSHLKMHYKVFDEKSYLDLPVQIIKAHDPFISFFKRKRVIYIVREGKSALQSYYHYKNSRKIIPLSPSDFIKPEYVEIYEWHKHLLSWGNASVDKLVIKFEDLKINAYPIIIKILDYLNLSYSDDIVNQAINNCSFEYMKRIEEEGYFNDNRVIKSESSNFIRKGSVGFNEEVFTEEQLKQFEKKSLEAYKRYHYNTDYI